MFIINFGFIIAGFFRTVKNSSKSLLTMTDPIHLVKKLKDLIKGVFDFIKTNIYLIPSPFSDIIIIALGIITTIFIVKIVGVIL